MRVIACLASIFALIFCSSNSFCYVISASSCGANDVQTAINSAKDGDTVFIPAGACTWTSQVNVGSGKSLKIQGAGESYTAITLDSPGDSDFNINLTAGKLIELTSMKFIMGTAGGTNNLIRLGGSAGLGSFRVHNLSILGNGSSGAIFYVVGDSYGVFDHLTVTGAISELINTFGGSCYSWMTPGGPGSPYAVYLEDSTINWDENASYLGRPVIDGQNGARFVARHNTIKNQLFGGHGADTGYMCGIMLQEVYNNTFTLQNAAETWGWSSKVRGGTTIAYNNNWSVSTSKQFGSGSCSTPGMGQWLLEIYRTQGDPGNYGAWRYACQAGNVLKVCSQVNPDWSNVSGFSRTLDCKVDSDCGSGNTCKWKMCSNSMRLCTSDSECSGGVCDRYLDGGNSGTGGYPCFQGPGRGRHDLSVPSYEWNNKFTGSTCTACQSSPCDLDFNTSPGTMLKEGVDFFNDTPMPGYAAYAYPHPLQAGQVPPGKLPNPPSGIGVQK